MIKKNILTALILSASFGAIANTYYVKIPADKFPTNKEYIIEEGEWKNDGGVTQCSAFLPVPQDVNLGETFTQTQTCNQNMTRELVYKEVDSFSGAITIVKTEFEKKTVNVPQEQEAVGTKNYIVSTVVGDWVYTVEDAKFECLTLKDTSSIYDLRMPDYPTWEVVSYSRPILNARQECKSNQHGAKDTVITYADGTEEKTTEKNSSVVKSYINKQFNLLNEAFYSENTYNYSGYKTSSFRGYTPYSQYMNGTTIYSSVRYAERNTDYSTGEAVVGYAPCCQNDSQASWRMTKLLK